MPGNRLDTAYGLLAATASAPAPALPAHLRTPARTGPGRSCAAARGGAATSPASEAPMNSPAKSEDDPGARPELLEQQRPLAQAHLALEDPLDGGCRYPLPRRWGYLPCCHSVHSSMPRARAPNTLTVLFATGCEAQWGGMAAGILQLSAQPAGKFRPVHACLGPRARAGTPLRPCSRPSCSDRQEWLSTADAQRRALYTTPPHLVMS